MVGENKLQPTQESVDAFLDAVPDPQRREDAKKIRVLMERLSGEPAELWTYGIVGFGRYRYRYDSGREGHAGRIGFSPRAKEQVLYLIGGFPRHQELMNKLGKYRTGKSCLYIKRLSDVDEAVLEELIAEALAYMRGTYPEGA